MLDIYLISRAFVYILIIPKTFNTELIKIMAKKAIQKYLINKLYIFCLLNSDDILISSSILLSVTECKMSTQVAIAAIGIITEFEIKSKKSRKSIPNSLILPKTL